MHGSASPPAGPPVRSVREELRQRTLVVLVSAGLSAAVAVVVQVAIGLAAR